MPDLLSLLHDERLLFEQLHSQANSLSGLSEGEALRCVDHDQGRLLRLEQAGLLTAATGPYRLTPQAKALLDTLLASPISETTPEPTTSSPMLKHLRWLEDLIEQGQLRSATNIDALLAQHHGLPLDGKEQWTTRPRLSDVAALRRRTPARNSGAHDRLVPTEGDEAMASVPSLDWLSLRGDFAQSQTDLLSFLRQISDDPAIIADCYLAALAMDAPRLQIHDQSLAWADRKWARITWRA